LLRLDAETLARAFGVASSLSAGTRLNFGTDAKPLHAGFAAANGIAAAELAARGATARIDALEAAMGFAELHGGRPPRIRTDRDRFCLVDPGIEHKPYPSCRFTHRIIEATARLRARHPGASPVRVECHMDAFAREILIYPDARSALEAKFSAPYCVALAWLHGAPEVATFTDERVLRDDTRALAARVQVVDGGKETESVKVFFGDGSEDRESIALPLGHPARPLSGEAHAAKVLSCLRTRLDEAPAARVMASLEGVAAIPDIRAVTRDLR
jgi:2-methylcitrate dehydratase PrpD